MINETIERINEYLKKEEIYYLFCDYGIKSRKVAKRLTELGYKVISIDGGFHEYENLTL